ncbi:MAG: phospholipase A [Burkholderiales bacterium]
MACVAGMAALADASGALPEACVDIAEDRARLACYDRAMGRKPADVPRAIEEPEPPAPPRPSLLSHIWDLDRSDDGERFTLRPHQTNYLLPFRYTSDTNGRPSSPVSGAAGGARPSPAEVKFRLSIKTRLAEKLFDGRLDLWVAYTQQAHWQLFLDSGPFREINHEPELMALYRLDRNLFGADLRFVNVGLSHHSNGRGDAGSRSWNRIYAQLGLDYGEHVAVLIRPWLRLGDLERVDTNPDISRYYGHGDIAAFYRNGGHAVGLTLRSALSVKEPRGAAQFDWYFPLYRQVKGYLQVFSGYGESLIDYNHRQNTIGLGIALVDWLER